MLSDSLVQAFRSINVNESGQQLIMPPVTVVTPQIVTPIARPQPQEKTPTPEEQQAEAERQQNAVRMRNMADEIRRVLEPLTRGGQVSVVEGAFGITVEINASVLFPPGEAVLGPQAVTALRAVADVIAPASFPVTIEGHTDNTPINTFRFPSNWELSAVRASSVVRLFVESGVAPERLTAAGYSDQRPVADNETEQGRSRNRRVAIQIESRVPEAPPSTPGVIPRGDPLRSILPPIPPVTPG